MLFQANSLNRDINEATNQAIDVEITNIIASLTRAEIPLVAEWVRVATLWKHLMYQTSRMLCLCARSKARGRKPTSYPCRMFVT